MDYSMMRQKICDIGYKLWLRGFCPSNAGNICVKVGDDEYLATPTMTNKGAMTPDMIFKVNGKLEILEECAPYALTSEIRLHIRALEIRSKDGATASIHTHSPFCQLYSILGTPSMKLEQEEMDELIGPRQIPITPYAKFGTWELADTINEPMRDIPFVILGHHGPLTVGKDLDEAFMLMEAIEHSAKISYLLQLYKK